jgi:hypothetical protein
MTLSAFFFALSFFESMNYRSFSGVSEVNHSGIPLNSTDFSLSFSVFFFASSFYGASINYRSSGNLPGMTFKLSSDSLVKLSGIYYS